MFIPLSGLLVVNVVLAGGERAKNFQRFLYRWFAGDCIEDLKCLRFQLRRDLSQGDIGTQIVVEPQRGAAEIKQITGNYEFELARLASLRLVGHVGDEAAI